MMKLALTIGIAATTTALMAVAPDVASAQSDKTLGIGCNVAGREHCGERGPLGGPGYYRYGWHHRHWHRWHYGYRY